MFSLTRSMVIVAMVLTAVTVQALDVVEALWRFDDYENGETIPDGGIVRDESGKDRHLVNRRANPVSTANTPNGSSAISMSGIDGGTGPRGATDFLEFIPGFSGFSNSSLTAANDPFVFPAGLHWMVEFVASNHENVNHAEGSMVSTGDADDGAGIDRMGVDVTENVVDLFHYDANDPVVGDFEKPFCRVTGLTPPYWHHIACVRDRQNDRLQIYRDGVLGPEATGVTGGHNVENTSGNLYVGAQIIANIEAAASARLFRGEIDFIRIVTRDEFGPGSQFGPADFMQDYPNPPEGTLVILR